MRTNFIIVFLKNLLPIIVIISAQLTLGADDLSKVLYLTTISSFLIAVTSLNLMFSAQAVLPSLPDQKVDQVLIGILIFRLVIILIVAIFITFFNISALALLIFISKTFFEFLFASYRVQSAFNAQRNLSLYGCIYFTIGLFGIIIFKENKDATTYLLFIAAADFLAVLTSIFIERFNLQFNLKAIKFCANLMYKTVRASIVTLPSTCIFPFLNGYSILYFHKILNTNSFNSLSLSAKYAIIALPAFAIISNSSVQNLIHNKFKKNFFLTEVKKIVGVALFSIAGLIIVCNVIYLYNIQLDGLTFCVLFVLFFFSSFYSWLQQTLVALNPKHYSFFKNNIALLAMLLSIFHIVLWVLPTIQPLQLFILLFMVLFLYCLRALKVIYGCLA